MTRSKVSSSRQQRPAVRAVLIVASFLLPTIGARAQTTAPNPDAAFLPLWNDLAARTGWQILVSPPFPSSWPPPAGGTLVRYAFAMRMNPAVADGVDMAAPWARSTLSPTGDITAERLSTRLQPLGVQGVRPMSSAEIALTNREQDVTRLLLAGGDQAATGVVRDFTCGWIARQGVVAAAITPWHPDFMKWLACP